jgi:membrane protein involved in colicin uptake
LQGSGFLPRHDTYTLTSICDAVLVYAGLGALRGLRTFRSSSNDFDRRKVERQRKRAEERRRERKREEERGKREEVER